MTVGCADDQEMMMQSQWDVLWEAGTEQVSGELVLYKDNLAKLKVFGNTNSLLVSDTSQVNYEWSLQQNALTLKRVDNGISLKYQILKKAPDMMELSFADDIKVNLHLKKGQSNI